ncbi:MAG: NAD(P)-dependent oxidoreductase [Pedosphaera sp.]|jgi:nucleoside-diphosphate-sugar epimerase|nr:NAD(P)-dependent oxidoreductase [Pedosphaera sp.]|tara:strand:- start:1344 stop:2114 length:771 start_codon:yes stop_codon:yes gene_type:complete
MSDPKTVLVTGSAGRVGQAAVQGLLERGHSVRGFDRAPSPGLPEATVADLSDLEALKAALDGVEALVHLAATPDDVEDPVNNLFPPNITGLYHTLELAREAGVQRLVLPSSGQVNWFRNFEGPWPLDETVPVSPKGWYAATKMFLESIGHSYAATHGMSVIIARLGWCPRDEGQVREIADETIYQDVYLSPADAGRFFIGCVEAAPEVRYEILYATSKPVETLRYRLDRAREIAAFEPQEQWPDGTEIIFGRRWTD